MAGVTAQDRSTLLLSVPEAEVWHETVLKWLALEESLSLPLVAHWDSQEVGLSLVENWWRATLFLYSGANGFGYAVSDLLCSEYPEAVHCYWDQASRYLWNPGVVLSSLNSLMISTVRECVSLVLLSRTHRLNNVHTANGNPFALSRCQL